MGGRGCVIVTPVQRHVMALGVRCGESGPYHSKNRIARAGLGEVSESARVVTPQRMGFERPPQKC